MHVVLWKLSMQTGKRHVHTLFGPAQSFAHAATLIVALAPKSWAAAALASVLLETRFWICSELSRYCGSCCSKSKRTFTLLNAACQQLQILDVF